jgi:hypothetical protein
MVGHFGRLAVQKVDDVARVAVDVVLNTCKSFLHDGFSG